ncbi:MAG: hypothetical protein AUJ89_05505 [Candidatus Omnitrophica bacterium CG1_02_43_210]|nr:MAG: hypothetical protein AUJ89_05505 [Candidatus Omnitrophica bacterium CG1_02_43_210]
MKNNRAGFTLFELLVSIAVMAIITTAIFLVLATGIESWQYATDRLLLQKASSDLMNYLMDGGYDSDGIRDMVELRQAGANHIVFSTLWTDNSHAFNKQENKNQKFILNRQYKAGSSVPIAQFRPPGDSDFKTASVSFKYGASKKPDELDDEITVLDKLTDLSDIKIIFTPDADQDESVQKVFYWDKDNKKVYETYNGATKELIEHNPGVKVEGVYYMYFDNLNQPVIPKQDGFVSKDELKKITAVKIYLFLSRNNEWQESTSFTNIRNVGSTGVSITAGTKIPMPLPDKIRAFSVGNLFGPRQSNNNQISFTATPNKGSTWKITIWVAKTGDNMLNFMRYAIEYPPGKIVNSSYVNQKFAPEEFINLMSVDRSGMYDYERDTDISGELVRIRADEVTLEVTRCDFDGASLFIRP